MQQFNTTVSKYNFNKQQLNTTASKYSFNTQQLKLPSLFIIESPKH